MGQFYISLQHSTKSATADLKNGKEMKLNSEQAPSKDIFSVLKAKTKLYP